MTKMIEVMITIVLSLPGIPGVNGPIVEMAATQQANGNVYVFTIHFDQGAAQNVLTVSDVDPVAGLLSSYRLDSSPLGELFAIDVETLPAPPIPGQSVSNQHAFTYTYSPDFTTPRVIRTCSCLDGGCGEPACQDIISPSGLGFSDSDLFTSGSYDWDDAFQHFLNGVVDGDGRAFVHELKLGQGSLRVDELFRLGDVTADPVTAGGLRTRQEELPPPLDANGLGDLNGLSQGFLYNQPTGETFFAQFDLSPGPFPEQVQSVDQLPVWRNQNHWSGETFLSHSARTGLTEASGFLNDSWHLARWRLYQEEDVSVGRYTGDSTNPFQFPVFLDDVDMLGDPLDVSAFYTGPNFSFDQTTSPRTLPSGGQEIQDLSPIASLQGTGPLAAVTTADPYSSQQLLAYLGRDGNPRIARVTSTCQPNERILCLGDGRFEVRAVFQTFANQLGFAKAQQITADTGLFTFLDESNVELVVKVLDACGLNGRFWIFGAGLTNLAVKLIVTDTTTGEERIFDNPIGTAYSPIQETTIGALPCDLSQVAMQVIQTPASEPAAPFVDPRAALAEAAALSFPAGGSCATSSNTLCITEGRFSVEIEFETASGVIPGRAQQLTTGSGYFWFLDADNVEVVIKVLNACGLNQRYWVLAAGLTNQGAKITVRDTETGNSRTYENVRGTAFQTILDTLVGLPCS